MMVLSRIWYVILSLLLGVALYVVYLAVGQYNRRNSVAMSEELASDSQTVGWALQIDARKRLDALLIGAVDKAVQDALQGANGKDPIPAKVKEDGRKALLAVLDKLPADFRPDALFVVDHDGRVLAQLGFDQANAYPDFELGGYPAVFDALHGFLRDDTWVLGGKIYRVVARPVEFDVTQPPIGAVVGLRSVDKKFAQDLSKRTRANIAFYAAGQRVVSAAVEGFDENQLDLITPDLAKVGTDKSYADGRSDVRFITDDVGVMYARLFGDAWELGAGFVVARGRIAIAGPLGFLSGADDKDKQSVPFLILAAAVVIGILGGMLLSLLEHSRPLKEMVGQANKLRRGELDYLQLPRFHGRYRAIAQDINAGIERVIEKGGGGALRKPADLESILGPVPAQPAMSAFSFPLADSGGAGPAPRSGGFPPPTPQAPGRDPLPTRPGVPPKPGASPFGPDTQAATYATPPPIQPIQPLQGPPIPPIQVASGGGTVPSNAANYAPAGGGGPAGGYGSGPGPGYSPAGGFGAAAVSGPSPFGQPARQAAFMPPGVEHAPADMDGPTMAAPSAHAESAHTPSGGAHVPVQGLRSAGAAPGGQQRGAPTMMGIQPPIAAPRPVPAPAQGVVLPPNNPFAVPTSPEEFFPPPRGPAQPAPPASAGNRALHDAGDEGEDEATVVAPAPSDLLAAATGNNKAVGDETAEWMSVYEEFVRTKKQCGEPTDGLTFEKFQHTLKKNRDALIQRHSCKRVRFSVYIKEGRASLKATPVRE